MARQTVRFCFDYLSPYAYFASLRMREICERHGAELVWHPVLFAGLLDHWGQRGPAEIMPKAMYTFRDSVRYAREHQIPFRSPRFHPFRPLEALRLSLTEVSGDDQALVIRTLYAHGWGKGGDMGSADELAGALDAAGLPGGELLERTRSDEAKQALRRGTEDAVSRGVFGIPTMLVGDELFWGNDSLRYVERHLEGRDPIDGVDMQELLSEGRGAWRPAAGSPWER